MQILLLLMYAPIGLAQAKAKTGESHLADVPKVLTWSADSLKRQK